MKFWGLIARSWVRVGDIGIAFADWCSRRESDARRRAREWGLMP